MSVFKVCPVIDHEFRHNIVKVAVDPRGDSRVDPQTKFMINNRTDVKKTDVNWLNFRSKNFSFETDQTEMSTFPGKLVHLACCHSQG